MKTVASHIPENCKAEFLRRLQLLDENITITRTHIVEGVTESKTYWYGPENIGTYANRLNGLIKQRDGICIALGILGLMVEWDGDHPVRIVPDPNDN